MKSSKNKLVTWKPILLKWLSGLLQIIQIPTDGSDDKKMMPVFIRVNRRGRS